jgi:hypothetical protein
VLVDTSIYAKVVNRTVIIILCALSEIQYASLSVHSVKIHDILEMLL